MKVCCVQFGRTISYLPLMLLILLQTVVSANANPQSTDPLDRICAGINNSYQCAQAIERSQLRKPALASVVMRARNGVRVKLRNGRWLTVNDVEKRGDEASVVKYNFRDYSRDLGYFLLHRQYYEGDDYLLIQDTTGHQSELQDLPVVSPDKSRLVTASNGISGGYNANGIQIWRLTKDGAVLEQSFDVKGWAPSDPVWTNNQEIRLVRTFPGSHKKEPFVIRFNQQHWEMGQ